MRIIAITTEKGGVGKTTTAVNLAAGLALKGRVVLLIDLDYQGNAGRALGIDKQEIAGKNIAQVLEGDLPLSEVTVEIRENLYLAPSCRELKFASKRIITEVNREVRLRDALSTVSNVDYVILDTPTDGIMNENAYMAANEIIAPVQMESFAAEGFGDLMLTIKEFRKYNPKIDITGILITMCKDTLNQSKFYVDDLRTSVFGDFVYKTEIPINVRLSEAQKAGKTITEFAPGSTGEKSYAAFTDEVIAQEKS